MAKWMVENVKRFINFLQHDLWRIDLVHDSKLRALAIETLRVTHLVIKGVKKDNCKLHAAALTYSTLMAMVPFLIIVFAIGKAIGFTKAEDNIRAFLVEYPEGIRVFFDHLLEIVQAVNPAALGAIGGIIFLLIVFRLLNGIEESFNQIWGVQSPRALTDKTRNYISVLVIAPVLVVVANTGSAALMGFASKTEWFGPVLRLGMQLASIGVLSVAFVAIFIFLPNTRVNFRAAAIGGLTSAILVIIVQYVILKFGALIFKSPKYTVYGSFASIPIFLFWLYINWTLLLFGAELAFAIQNRKTYQEEQRAVSASMISKLWVAFSVMQEAVRVFEGPEVSLDAVRYARLNNIPIRLMNEVISLLVRAHLLGAVVDGDHEGYVLLQAPEHVTAKKIYDLLLADGSSPEDLGLLKIEITEEVLATADLGIGEALDPITLRKFFERGQ